MRTRTTTEIWTTDGITYRETTERKGSIVIVQRCRLHGNEHPLLKVEEMFGQNRRTRSCPECDYIAYEIDTYEENR